MMQLEITTFFEPSDNLRAKDHVFQ